MVILDCTVQLEDQLARIFFVDENLDIADPHVDVERIPQSHNGGVALRKTPVRREEIRGFHDDYASSMS